ncbi:MAG: helix-turn-helix domain-containing protein, partial [Thiogranum sp.]
VLANHFLEKESEKQKKAGMGFSSDALAAMDAYEWPGNVRELQNRIKRAVILTQGKQITASNLELAPVESTPLLLNLRQVREKAESQALLTAFQQANGKISQAAKMLGITRPTFYALVKKYNLGLGDTAS